MQRRKQAQGERKSVVKVGRRKKWKAIYFDSDFQTGTKSGHPGHRSSQCVCVCACVRRLIRSMHTFARQKLERYNEERYQTRKINGTFPNGVEAEAETVAAATLLSYRLHPISANTSLHRIFFFFFFFQGKNSAEFSASTDFLLPGQQQQFSNATPVLLF